MRKHRLGKHLLIVLCVVLIVFLAGCRPSPVLEQIIYEQNHQVDPDTETKTMNDDLENEEPDEDIPSRETVDDSEQTKDQEYNSALAGDEDTDSEDPYAVYDVAYSPSGDLSVPTETNPSADSTSDTATGSTKTGGDEGGNLASGEGSEPGNDGTSDGDSGGGTDAGAGQTDGGNGDLDGEPDSGSGQTPTKERVMTHINLENGEELDIPTNVETVAAPGEVATIVEMLDSDGRLVATSSSFTENSFAQDAFDLSGVSVCWSGDGSSYCDDFDLLLEADPDVCFTISGQDTLSEGQIATLNERNIGYVVLPEMDSIDHIKEAVNLVGLVLDQSTEGRTGAQAVASDYCSWAEKTINWAKSGTYSTKATTYIGEWDYEAYWKVANSTRILGEGYGVPVSTKYNGLNECMGYVGLINTSQVGHYVEPVNRYTYEPTITGERIFPKAYRDYITYSDVLEVGLGTEKFPAVIVEESTIRDNILNAEEGKYFRYHWWAGTFVQFENYKGYGVDDGFGGIIGTDIQDTHAYQILVNPSGVGNWAKGSVETPLEALWLACEFQGAVTKGEVENEVRNFYSTFYNNYQVDASRVMPEDWTYPGY